MIAFLILVLLGVTIYLGRAVADLREQMRFAMGTIELLENRLSRVERSPAPPRAQSALSPTEPAEAPPQDVDAQREADLVKVRASVAKRAAAVVRSEPVVVSAPVKEPVAPPPPLPPPESLPEPRLSVAERFEALVGGRLPIWIGGIALILSAFFLVRYSIEQGLLGPSVRAAIAGVFGLLLLGGSEAARHWGKTRDDPRIGQALAGAGIASLYGTLYMAGQLYGLIGPVTAFVLMAAVTAAALVLSLRHGPPTAILGMIGGFAAPFLADSGSGQIVPVLIYLGLLLSGLFALALHRGWMWLAMAATGGGILWAGVLMLGGRFGDGSALGLFIVACAIGAAIVIPRMEPAQKWMPALPMVAGLLQLMVLAPLVQFSLTGWLLYGLLSAACLVLGWKDARMMPASVMALVLVCVLIFAGGSSGHALAGGAAIGATLLFGLPGHALALRSDSRFWWTMLALGAIVGPLMAYSGGIDGQLDDQSMGALWALGAAVAASLSWRARDLDILARHAAAALAGAMAFVALLYWLDSLWLAAATLAIACLLASWGRKVEDRWIGWASLTMAMLASLCWMISFVMDVARLLEALFADGSMPSVQNLLGLFLLPLSGSIALAWLHRGTTAAEMFRWGALLLAAALALALVPQDWHPAALAALFALGLVSPKPLPLPHWGQEALLGLTTLALLVPLSCLIGIAGSSVLLAETLHFDSLPSLQTAALALALPGLLLILGCARQEERLSGYGSAGAIVVAGLALSSFAYTLAKQPLAIATPEAFLQWGFTERAVFTQFCLAAGWLMWRSGRFGTRWPMLPFALGLFRFVWFDLVQMNPVWVPQQVGWLILMNAAVLHSLAVAFWLWLARDLSAHAKVSRAMRIGALLVSLVAVLAFVRQAFQGSLMSARDVPLGENYGYSLALLLLSIGWIWLGMRQKWNWLRIGGLLLLTGVTVKVFLIDAAALQGLMRVFSFLGLGAALMGIGWAYGRLSRAARETA